jgi:hypothetical protein
VSGELQSQVSCVADTLHGADAHLRDFNNIHEAHQKFVKEDGPADLINFDRCHRVRDGARHVLSYQEPALNPTNSARHAEIQSFVEAQLRSFVVDDTLDNWLQERGTKLAREEKADYFDYGGHKKELVAGGYLRPITFTSPPKPPRGSKPASPRPSSSTYNSNVSSPITPTTGTLLSQFPQIPDGTMGEVFSLDMSFNRKSKFCLDGRIARPSQHTVVSGGFSDIREGFLGNQKVAIKTIRPFSNMGKRIEDDTLRKVCICLYLSAVDLTDMRVANLARIHVLDQGLPSQCARMSRLLVRLLSKAFHCSIFDIALDVKRDP